MPEVVISAGNMEGSKVCPPRPYTFVGIMTNEMSRTVGECWGRETIRVPLD